MRRNDFVIELSGDTANRCSASRRPHPPRIDGEFQTGRPRTGSRAHSKVHRNTVTAAFHELIMQGWLVNGTVPRTLVSPDLPTLGSLRHETKGAAPQQRRSSLYPYAGFPRYFRHSRLMPSTQLARAFRHALSGPSLLSGEGYGDPRGAYALRRAFMYSSCCTNAGSTAAPDEFAGHARCCIAFGYPS